MGVVSLAEALPIEQARVRELVTEYEGLPGGAGMLGAMLMKQYLSAAERAAMSGDVIAMIQAYNDLKGCTG